MSHHAVTDTARMNSISSGLYSCRCLTAKTVFLLFIIYDFTKVEWKTPEKMRGSTFMNHLGDTSK